MHRPYDCMVCKAVSLPKSLHHAGKHLQHHAACPVYQPQQVPSKLQNTHNRQTGAMCAMYTSWHVHQTGAQWTHLDPVESCAGSACATAQAAGPLLPVGHACPPDRLAAAQKLQGHGLHACCVDFEWLPAINGTELDIVQHPRENWGKAFSACHSLLGNCGAGVAITYHHTESSDVVTLKCVVIVLDTWTPDLAPGAHQAL